MRKKDNERLLELSNIKKAENIKEHNTLSKFNWLKEAPDGKVFAIIKEGGKYNVMVADSSINLKYSDFDYLDGAVNKHRTISESYSEALKRMSFIFSKYNSDYGLKKSININESDSPDKFVLKFKAPEKEIKPETPPVTDFQEIENEVTLDPDKISDEAAISSMEDIGGDENQGDGDSDTKKDIMSLTGQLAQKIRSSESEMDKTDYKSVFNSISSAIDFSKFSESELNELKNRLDGEVREDGQGEGGSVTNTDEESIQVKDDGIQNSENNETEVEIKEESAEPKLENSKEEDLIVDEISTENMIGKKLNLTSRIVSAKPFGDGNKFYKVKLSNGEKMTLTVDELNSMLAETEIKEKSLKLMKENASKVKDKHGDVIYKEYSKYFKMIKESEGIDELKFNLDLFTTWKKKRVL